MAKLPEIFISYRRDDPGEPGLLYDALVKRLGRQAVFMDRTSLPRKPGASFPDELRAALDAAKVVLVLIGRRWTAIEDEKSGQRRLHVEGDWVTREVSHALLKAPLVIPVLLDGAAKPIKEELPESIRELCDREYAHVSDRHRKSDVRSLVKAIRKALAEDPERPSFWPAGAACALAGAAAIFLVWFTGARALPGHGAARAQLDRWMDRFVDMPDGSERIVLIVDSETAPDDPDAWRVRRGDHARLIDGLSRAGETGAAVIAFDLFFEDRLAPGPAQPDTTAALAAAIAASKVPIVLGVRQLEEIEDPLVEGAKLKRPKLEPSLRQAAGDGWGLAEHRGRPSPTLPRIELARLRHGRGLVWDEVWPSLALRTLLALEGAERASLDPGGGSIRLSGGARAAQRSIPVQRSGDRMLFAFRLGADSRLVELPYDDVLGWVESDPNRLRDLESKAVIVASGQEELLPGFEDLPGHQIQARMLAGLLAGPQGYVRSPGGLGTTLGLLAFALLGCAWRLRRSRPLAILEAGSPYAHWALNGADLVLGGAIAVAGLVVVSLVLYKLLLLVLPVFYWLAAFMTAYLALAVVERRWAS